MTASGLLRAAALSALAAAAAACAGAGARAACGPDEVFLPNYGQCYKMGPLDPVPPAPAKKQRALSARKDRGPRTGPGARAGRPGGARDATGR